MTTTQELIRIHKLGTPNTEGKKQFIADLMYSSNILNIVVDDIYEHVCNIYHIPIKETAIKQEEE